MDALNNMNNNQDNNYGDDYNDNENVQYVDNVSSNRKRMDDFINKNASKYECTHSYGSIDK